MLMMAQNGLKYSMIIVNFVANKNCTKCCMAHQVKPNNQCENCWLVFFLFKFTFVAHENSVFSGWLLKIPGRPNDDNET